jgi:protein-tyrosine-phosphatase
VNISYEPNIDETSVITEKFSADVDLFLDSGPVFSLKGSSVIDLTASPPVLIREGDVLKEEIERKLNIKIIGKIDRHYTITFICSGNICRSPMAEGILRGMLEKTKFAKQIEINSAGTLNLDSSRASEEAIRISEKHNVNISDHISSPIDRQILDKANIIICMAAYHYNLLIRNYPEYADKIYILKTMDSEDNIFDPSIADPIGLSEEFYNQIFLEIQKELKRILPSLLVRIEKHLA